MSIGEVNKSVHIQINESELITIVDFGRVVSINLYEFIEPVADDGDYREVFSVNPKLDKGSLKVIGQFTVVRKQLNVHANNINVSESLVRWLMMLSLTPTSRYVVDIIRTNFLEMLGVPHEG